MIQNKLLLRQLQKYFGGAENVPAEMHDFLAAVNESYDHYEKDHKMLERSIDFSSGEMISLNNELREETRKLKSAHYELKMLFENIDEVFFSVDMKAFKLIQMSASCEKIYGYTQEEFYLNSSLWRASIHPEDRHISEQQLGQLNIGEKVINQYRIIRKDGSERWVENKVIPTLDESGNLIRIDGITSDITERKKAEALILESEKKYRLVFENPFLGVAIGTMEGKIMNANKAFYSLLGYTKEEIRGLHFSKFTYSPDVEKEMQFITQMTNREIDNYQLEKRYITKSNEIIWVELSMSCVVNESGDIQLAIAVIQDITAKKQAKELLLKSEANLRNIFENTDTAYVLLDEKANILSFNQIALQMSMDELEETIAPGKNYPDLMLNDKKGDVRRKIDNVLATGRPVKYEAAYPKLDKPTTWLHVSLHPIFNEEKKVIGLSVAATDITDRKKSEIQINESNKRYELITKATKDIIWDWDVVTNKMFRSSNYHQVFGYSNPDNLYSEPWTSGIHPDDLDRIWESIALKANDPTAVLWEENYKYFRQNGEIAYVQDRAYIIRNEANEAIRLVGAMRDVTKEKMLSNERDKITSDLSQRNRDLEQFAFIVSHNLRTPVANIIGLMNLLRDHNLDENEQKKCMDGLLLSTAKLDGVIRDMNHILQVRHEISEKKEPVLFSELVADIKISIQNLLQKENAVIEADFSELDELFTLKSYIYSIFFNLISNSIKYRNGVTPVITICSRRVNNKVLLTFKDNGLGIDLVAQENKIFGLYNKFHFHTEGKGMGLYMTKTQVEILGGKISVKSDVNKGTEFFVELPV